jgi:glycosyltransferase involved in cell wall biosynthesis
VAAIATLESPDQPARFQAGRGLRVCAFFQHMPPYSGAAALRGASIMTALAGRLQDGPGHVEVYSTIPAPAPLPGLTVRSIGVPEVENALSLPARIVGELRVGRAAAKAMFARGVRWDLAVVSTPGYLAALVIAAAARKRGIPYVIELRDVYPQVYAEAGLLSRSSWLYRFFARRSGRMYEGARAVIAATRGLARTVSEDSPAARVHHVYNGFPAELLGRAAPKHARFTVCFHGVMGFFQDIETLAEVARRLVPHDVDVAVIGYGRKEPLIAGSGLPNVRAFGRLSFEATMAEVERCHVGLCLRKDEAISRDAFPVKVWEYLGLGLPSIVTPLCEAGEFLERNGCGIQLPAADVDRIVGEILRLRSDEGALSAMAQRCRQTAPRFTREATGSEAAGIVAHCAEGAAASARSTQSGPTK